MFKAFRNERSAETRLLSMCFSFPAATRPVSSRARLGLPFSPLSCLADTVSLRVQAGAVSRRCRLLFACLPASRSFWLLSNLEACLRFKSYQAYKSAGFHWVPTWSDHLEAKLGSRIIVAVGPGSDDTKAFSLALQPCRSLCRTQLLCFLCEDLPLDQMMERSMLGASPVFWYDLGQQLCSSCVVCTKTASWAPVQALAIDTLARKRLMPTAAAGCCFHLCTISDFLSLGTHW